ncbi:MAG: DMT family transporter [Spirochaetales bacterium]|nr:DMT family transporter [Spirochaetales bacterium]
MAEVLSSPGQTGSRIAVPAVILAAALGASSGLYIKSLGFSSLALTGFRMCIPFFFFLPGMIRKKMVFGPPRMRKRIITASLLNGIRMFLYVIAYKLTSLANAVVLVYLWPLFALILHSVMKKEKLKLRELGLILLAIFGVVLLNFQKGFSFSPDHMAGNLFMALSAFLFSFTALIFKDALADHSEGEVVYFQNALGALVFLPFLLIEASSAPLPEILWGSLYGLSVGVGAWACFFIALKRLPVFQYGALTYVEVFFGVLFGAVFLGESITGFTVTGILLVLSASVLSRFAPEQKKA